jgi:hypothetical protein
MKDKVIILIPSLADSLVLFIVFEDLQLFFVLVRNDLLLILLPCFA